MNMKKFVIPALLVAAFAAEAYDIHSKALTPIIEKAKPAGAPMTFVKDGKADFSIVFDAKNQQAARAAKLLMECFERTTGAKPAAEGRYTLEIVAAEDPLEQRLAVKTSPKGVTLSGNPWYAALDFAERFLGVRWYFPDENGIIYPKTAEFTVQPVHYEDEPWFSGYRGDKFYPYTSVENDDRRRHWDKYFAKKIQKDDVSKISEFMDHWRVGGRGCGFSGGHSPRPERVAKAHPDKLRTIFYTSPYGKFWYNPGGHVGNYFNVLDLGFADLLIEDWKTYYASNGKIDNGGYADACYPESVSFGCCDTYMPISEVRSDPIVQKLGLVKESDLARDKDAGMCNIYARFYQYLGEKLKKELPGKKLGLLIYYNTKCASLDPRFKLPDNVELFVCDGRLPGKTRNPKEMEKTIRLFREWYEACGNRPVKKAWLYAARFDKFGRAVMPEFIGDVPKVLGKYLSREGAVFYDSDGGSDYWHIFYSQYVGTRAQWNPDLDTDAAIDAILDDLLGAEAGAWMKKFHRAMKAAYVEYGVSTAGESGESRGFPRTVIDELEKCLKEAEALLNPDSVEMKRFRLIADYWPEAFKTQRALADYEPPVYEVKRFTEGMDWSKVADMPMVEFKSGAAQKIASSLKLAWDEKGLHVRFHAPYAPKADKAKDLWSNDGLELLFTPGLTKEQVYQFVCDCLGQTFVQKQRLLPIPQPPNASYKGEGFTHTEKIGDGEWSGEYLLPWSLFEEGAPKAYDSWNANLVRNKRSEPREVVSTAFTLGKHANTQMFGILRFLGKGD